MQNKWLVLLFFGLISLGQGYPFAYALSHGEAVHAQCSCNRSGRKCVHGCALKRKSKSPPSAVMSQSQASAPQPSSEEQWVSAQCSRQQQAKILSFHSDPFVIPQEMRDIPLTGTEWGIQSLPVSSPWTLACESPPPKPNPPDAS